MTGSRVRLSSIGIGITAEIFRPLSELKQGISPFCRSLVFAGLVMLPTPLAARCPDLALVLAIDASGSVGPAEFQLQLQGYASAFRSVAVQEAIQSVGKVEVGIVLWADGEMRPQVLPFRDVSTAKAASDLATDILGVQRAVTGNTGIGRGLWTALDLIEEQAACAFRRVVNVSGDGKESMGPRPRNSINLSIARLRAERMDVTVNALAIQTETKDLADWYQKNLIEGPGSFVMSISQISSFAEAIELKLAREISNPMTARSEAGDDARPTQTMFSLN